MNTETKLKTLMIDMDDVICKGGYLYLVNDFLGTSYKEENITDYYLQHLVPENRMDEFHKYFLERNVYDYVIFEEGAREALEKLNKKYDIYLSLIHI